MFNLVEYIDQELEKFANCIRVNDTLHVDIKTAIIEQSRFFASTLVTMAAEARKTYTLKPTTGWRHSEWCSDAFVFAGHGLARFFVLWNLSNNSILDAIEHYYGISFTGTGIHREAKNITTPEGTRVYVLHYMDHSPTVTLSAKEENRLFCIPKAEFEANYRIL
jgi:hypothetical protein